MAAVPGKKITPEKKVTGIFSTSLFFYFVRGFYLKNFCIFGNIIDYLTRLID